MTLKSNSGYMCFYDSRASDMHGERLEVQWEASGSSLCVFLETWLTTSGRFPQRRCGGRNLEVTLARFLDG